MSIDYTSCAFLCNVWSCVNFVYFYVALTFLMPPNNFEQKIIEQYNTKNYTLPFILILFNLPYQRLFLQSIVFWFLICWVFNWQPPFLSSLSVLLPDKTVFKAYYLILVILDYSYFFTFLLRRTRSTSPKSSMHWHYCPRSVQFKQYPSLSLFLHIQKNKCIYTIHILCSTIFIYDLPSPKPSRLECREAEINMHESDP